MEHASQELAETNSVGLSMSSLLSFLMWNLQVSKGQMLLEIIKDSHINWVWWPLHVILTFRRQKQEDQSTLRGKP